MKLYCSRKYVEIFSILLLHLLLQKSYMIISADRFTSAINLEKDLFCSRSLPIFVCFSLSLSLSLSLSPPPPCSYSLLIHLLSYSPILLTSNLPPPSPQPSSLNLTLILLSRFIFYPRVSCSVVPTHPLSISHRVFPPCSPLLSIWIPGKSPGTCTERSQHSSI